MPRAAGGMVDQVPAKDRPLSATTAALWAAARLVVWPEQYTLASLPPAALAAGARLVGSARSRFAALVAERDEVALTVERGRWERSSLRRRARSQAGPFRAITVDLDLELDLCGFLAPAAERLAAAGVSIVPQCGYLKDHLLVQEAQLERAIGVLQGMMRACRHQARTAGMKVARPYRRGRRSGS